jgi:amidohydrolase
MIDKIKKLSTASYDEAVNLRRYMHMHPELSYHEEKTGAFITEKLKSYGIPYQHGIAVNGVVALIEGKNKDKKVIALRADFDALPITEENEVPYKSQNIGVMHACGHDYHTATLLLVGKILYDLRDEFEGTIKLIFQPAEEKLPGGASIMIAEGVLENPKPISIIGQHVYPPLEAGKVGLKPGPYMASSDEMYVTVTGKGGHGAMPQECIDPIVIASNMIISLQQIISRRANPSIPTVLTFGKINSVGGATNVIPDQVKLEGTFRTFDEVWRNEAHLLMKNQAENIAKSMGGNVDFDIVKGYPVLNNDEALTYRVKKAMIEYCGKDNVVDLPIRMTSEDFAYYTQKVDACFYRIGTGNKEKGITSGLHTPTFDIDESSFRLGIGLMTWLAIHELRIDD